MPRSSVLVDSSLSLCWVLCAYNARNTHWISIKKPQSLTSVVSETIVPGGYNGVGLETIIMMCLVI